MARPVKNVTVEITADLSKLEQSLDRAELLTATHHARRAAKEFDDAMAKVQEIIVRDGSSAAEALEGIL